MDKDHSKVFLGIIVFILVLISVFGIKDLVKRREINKLLLVKPVESVMEPTITNTNKEKKYIKQMSAESKKETSSSYDDNSDKVSEMKIPNTSANVEKKDKTGIDFISSQDDVQAVDINSPNTDTNLENINLLARLIQSEAGDEPYMGKLAVGNVVLYRTSQDNTSIKDTIFKKGQFDGVSTSNFNIQPSEDCVRAATEVINGKNVLTDGYYFVNLKEASPSWAKSDNFIERIGDHWFFRKDS